MTQYNKIQLILLTMLLVASQVWALEVNHLNHPESVVHDPEAGYYYITNINGAPLEKDNNGYISKVSSDGLVIVLKFIKPKEGVSELHAPKGMAILNQALYVADIDVIRSYDLDTGVFLGTIEFDQYEPQFFNDLTVDPDEEVLYVSDTFANRIFKIDTKHDNTIEIFSEGEKLGKPNGLHFDGHNGHLLVATWQTGEILDLDEQGQIEVLKRGLEGLDGIFMDRSGTLFVSSHSLGVIYMIGDRGLGTIKHFKEGLNTPSDIAYDSDKNEVLVPLMMDNRVLSLDIAGLKKTKK